jgi:uncharacterized protein (TIGR00106 family)
MANRVIAEVSVVPVGTGSTGLSQFIAACLDALESKREISYQLTPMGTIIEGTLEKVFEGIQALHEAPFSKGVARVVTWVKIDDRRDRETTMTSKVESVLKLRQSGKTRQR